MATNIESEVSPSGRIGIIQAVQTPLGFFVLVVLIVEATLGVIIFRLDTGTDRTILLVSMITLIFALVLIVAGIAAWRPTVLSGKEYQRSETKYSLLIGPPDNLRNLDITLISWDNNGCFLVSGELKERISLVRSRVGPTFRVSIPPKVLQKVKDEVISLELKDNKGNRWEVRSFYLYENLMPLSLVESMTKIIDDYGEES